VVVAQKAKSHTLTTDEAKMVKKDAATLFGGSDYNGALKGYQELIKTDKNNAEFNYRLGFCYLMTNVDKTKAVEYLEAAGKGKNVPKEAPYYLGMAYMYASKWDEAIASFEEYKTATHSKPIKDFPDVDKQEEMCENARELTAHPKNVKFENPGKFVNSIYQDYNPFISADGDKLVFTSRRKGNMGGFIEDLGMYSADVYWSQWKDTAWSKAKSVGDSVNSEWDEESVGLSADGNLVLVYMDNVEVYSDITVSTLKGKTWQKAVLIGSPVNTKAFETAGSMSLDGTTIYFASERKEGKGGSDIFLSKRVDVHEWGPAVNLGPVINTNMDEDAPFISMDGKTLYFSSKGHNTMGGFDVFRSKYDEETESWSEPENIGYPVNTVDDNLFFSMTGDQRYAYISALREGGLGDKDIYKITYLDTTDHPFLALISGIVTPEASGKIEITKAVLTNEKDKSVIMTYVPFTPGNEFVLAAAPGEYELTVEGYNFPKYTEKISIPAGDPISNITKKIIVKTGKQ